MPDHEAGLNLEMMPAFGNASGAGAEAGLEEALPKEPRRRPLIPDGGLPNFPKWVNRDEAGPKIPEPPASLVADQQLVRAAANQATW